MNQTVGALNSLSIFGPHQAGAYREHAQAAMAVLGAGINTRVQGWVSDWAKSGESGILVLTGNAGTGKTAIAEAWCAVAGGQLPTDDGLAEVATRRWAVKDLSGVLPKERTAVLALADAIGQGNQEGQLLLCANEGLLRTALEGSDSQQLLTLLDQALTEGAARAHKPFRATVLNMNRQRWTEPVLWGALLDYLTRPGLWEDCEECAVAGACPIRANAEALQREAPRDALRQLVQFASGSTVATLRQLLSILALGITGGLSCEDVRVASEPFDVEFAYFNLALGSSLPAERVERSGLLQSMREADLGNVADLAVDGWLRDTGAAPSGVEQLADPPSADLHAEVQTKIGRMSFAKLGETLTVSDDADAVRLCMDDFAAGRRFLASWRRRIFFEAQGALGGYRGAFRRLSAFPFFGDLLALAEALRRGREPSEERSRLITGLNYLVAGFHAYPGSLVVPDPGSLSARNPGAFRQPDPSVVHSEIPVGAISLRLEDGAQLREMLDTDDVRVLLVASVAEGRTAELLLTPRLYQAIRDSNDYRAPVGAGIPEMAEVATFYATLADTPASDKLKIVDPASKVIKEIALPDLAVT